MFWLAIFGVFMNIVFAFAFHGLNPDISTNFFWAAVLFGVGALFHATSNTDDEDSL